MLSLILRRIIVAIPTLFLVSVIVFGLQRLLPGDPILTLAAEDPDPELIDYLRAKYRLDQPIPIQYLAWIGQVLQGDFGMSLRTELPVAEMILQKLPITIQLATMSILLAMLIGIPAGIIAAVRKNTSLDYAANVVALSGMSIPNFWFGILLIMFFSVWLGWLPATGYVPLDEGLWPSIRAMLMPSFVLATAVSAYLMRHTRSAMIGVLSSDYVRTARAKGLRSRSVVLKHALRNALMPIVTISTLLFGELLAGVVLTEQIFTIPGFGKLIVDAVFTRDYAVVQGVVLCTALGFILANLLADILYIVINPRLRHPR
ncbi:peptide/nickel transport system permease protein [Nitratireductor aquibiodomus]|uniref:Peptide/nickel transport system permease protein n=1 Tax=Nitratireductor aquibiodomus TaxID=204799 RepID=A0A1H4KF00_9HYPH|nr:ABC transporter permease [Nitratireductor aquibiodomus]SEB57071.1 peptide/nickel transport system permease protein [Nitratireductor aquibiodomus]